VGKDLGQRGEEKYKRKHSRGGYRMIFYGKRKGEHDEGMKKTAGNVAPT